MWYMIGGKNPNQYVSRYHILPNLHIWNTTSIVYQLIVWRGFLFFPTNLFVYFHPQDHAALINTS